MRSPKVILPLLVSLLLSCVVISQLIQEYPYHLDEGVSLDAGVRILKGQVPYRDFFHITTPGAAYLLALMYKIFGVSLLSARILVAVFLFMILIVLFTTGMRLVRDSLLVSLGIFLIALLETLPLVNFSTHRLSVFFSILALWVILSVRNPSGMVFPGLLASCSFFMNQNIGGFAVLGSSILALSQPWFERRRNTWTQGLKNFLFLCLGEAALVIPVAAYLGWKGALGDFMSDAFLWASSAYKDFNQYPYYSFELGVLREDIGRLTGGELSLVSLGQFGLLPATGFLPFIIYPLYIVSSLFRRVWEPWAVSIIGVCLFLSAWTRPDSYHVFHILPPLVLLCLFLLSSLWENLRKNRLGLVPFSLVGALFFLILLDGLVFLPTPKANPSFPVRSERGTMYTVNSDEAAAVQHFISYISSTTSAGDPIFIYHWSPGLYFVLNRDNPTGFDSYIPVYNSSEQLSLLRTQLKKSPPRLIIKDSYINEFRGPYPWQRKMFPFVDPIRLLSEDSVDRFIKENYTPAARFGPYTIFRRK